MRTSPLTTHAEAPIKLGYWLTETGTCALTIKDNAYTGCTVFAVHDLPERVARLVEVGNAILAGCRVVILPEDRDAEHAASPAGRLAAEIEASDPVDTRHAAALATGLPQAGDRVRQAEDVAALSLT